MSMLTRWNPFKTPASVPALQDFEDIFRGFGLRPMLREMESAPSMRIEVSEDDKAYAVMAEIPGVKKEDINVTIDGHMVNISAEVKRETEQKEENQLYSERYFGRVQRSFSLPMDVDQDKALARYENGVLQLSLPKKPNGSSRRITLS